MASNARNQPPGRSGIADNAPRHTVIEEFDIPNEDGLWGERTKDFGSIRTLGMQLLTPLQQSHAISAAKGDPLRMAFELARRAVAFVKSDVGNPEPERYERFNLAEHDGTSAACWAQMNPRIRALAMQANAEISSPNEQTQAAFLASRRITAG